MCYEQRIWLYKFFSRCMIANLTVFWELPIIYLLSWLKDINVHSVADTPDKNGIITSVQLFYLFRLSISNIFSCTYNFVFKCYLKGESVEWISRNGFLVKLSTVIKLLTLSDWLQSSVPIVTEPIWCEQ